MSPTARTIQWAKKKGWVAGITEKWNPFAHIRQDLFNMIDVLIMRPKTRSEWPRWGLDAYQITSGSNAASRVTKLLANPNLKRWVLTGNDIYVASWERQGPHGKRKLWTLRRQRAVLEGDMVRFVEVEDLPDLDAGLESVDGSVSVEVPSTETADRQVRRKSDVAFQDISE